MAPEMLEESQQQTGLQAEMLVRYRFDLRGSVSVSFSASFSVSASVLVSVSVFVSVSVSRPNVWIRSQGQNFCFVFYLEAKISVSRGLRAKILVVSVLASTVLSRSQSRAREFGLGLDVGREGSVSLNVAGRNVVTLRRRPRVAPAKVSTSVRRPKLRSRPARHGAEISVLVSNVRSPAARTWSVRRPHAVELAVVERDAAAVINKQRQKRICSEEKVTVQRL